MAFRNRQGAVWNFPSESGTWDVSGSVAGFSNAFAINVSRECSDMFYPTNQPVRRDNELLTMLNANGNLLTYVKYAWGVGCRVTSLVYTPSNSAREGT